MREVSLASIQPEKKEDLSKVIEAAVKAALSGQPVPVIKPSTVVNPPEVNVTVQKPAAKHVIEVKRDGAGRIERMIVSAYEPE
jgi:thiamine pyrophosphate-dependent acetolactate synthase large subunit-like protein